MNDPSASIAAALRAVNAGNVAAARAILDRLAIQYASHPDVLHHHIVCAGMMGDFATARASAEHATRVVPHRALFWAFLSQANISLQDYSAAEAAARRALALEPANVDTMRGLAWILHRVSRFSEAAELARTALQGAPTDADLWLKCAIALQCLGRVGDAAMIYARAVAACPGSVELAEGRAACSNYIPDLSPPERFDLHQRFGDLISREALDCRSRPVDTRAGMSRPLRVALLSSDLRTHSVSYFITPVLRDVDSKRIELHVFHVGSVEDATTRSLRSLLPVDRWRFLRRESASPQLVDSAIRAAAIDVCVDLNGLTFDHSLRAMARRPAPLQCSYLGYPNTTGLSAMDCRIVDSLTDPRPDADAACTERLLRLDPCFLCYTPPPDAPEPAPAPGAASTPITFGSFNMITKVNDAVLTMWCRVVARVPEARLVIKSRGLEFAGVLKDVRSRADAAARAAGIDPGRIDFAGWMDARAAHLTAYAGIDIALDTFPYNGTTTTCEALLMGVPVVTLAGDTHASRVGLSLLSAVGLRHLCSHSSDDFIEKATVLANDRAQLSSLRASLRRRLRASPLCDGPGFADRFYSAIEAEWARKCGR